ncbi:MAG: hypothetical protein KDA92_12145 [Planctomycetales bacterium]|nr:hypothetical protein [Planctomycetales bacterium]MCA9166404.1 hypothetical protein [Planctomycetales bacterium]
MNDSGRDLQRAIEELSSEIEHVERVLDAEKRVVRASRLVEAIIKSHFTTRSSERRGLRTLIEIRRRFLGRRLYEDAAFAVNVRNRIAHHTLEGEPTEKELSEAAAVFIKIIRKHLTALERRDEEKHDPAGEQRMATDSEVLTGNVPFGTSNEHEVDTEESTAQQATVTPRVKRTPRRSLDATDDDPAVTASDVAEYTFCPRAGVSTHECKREELDDELPSLGRMLWYEADKIEDDYGRSSYRLFWMVVGLLCSFAIFALTPLIASPGAVFALLGGVGIWVCYFTLEFFTWRVLSKRRLEFKLAVPCDPNPNSATIQNVDWFGLLAAGYDAFEPKKSLADPQWKLTGKPRRIIRKGGLAIPVHRVRSNGGPPKPQHIVRAMALCHLVDVSEGASSPFAVILYSGSYQGITIPANQRNRELFYSALERARKGIRDSDLGERQPSEPPTASPCKNCPHGRPRRASDGVPTMRYGEILDPYVLVDRKSRIYHSSCGDRFRWKPPHERSHRLYRPPS